MGFRPLPSIERLNNLLFYDEEDGDLYLRVDRGPRKSGMLAGGEAGLHMTVAVDGIRYLAHRIIWKMKTGKDPALDIDHKDTDGKNNRFLNLREATVSQNLQNMKISRRNKSGVKGVYYNPLNDNWQVSIMRDRKVHRLGGYKKLEDAIAVAITAREKLHGDFARAA